jgi:hypothetical protein
MRMARSIFERPRRHEQIAARCRRSGAGLQTSASVVWCAAQARSHTNANPIVAEADMRPLIQLPKRGTASWFSRPFHHRLLFARSHHGVATAAIHECQPHPRCDADLGSGRRSDLRFAVPHHRLPRSASAALRSAICKAAIETPATPATAVDQVRTRSKQGDKRARREQSLSRSST